jgi:cell shape-determining protein MreC
MKSRFAIFFVIALVSIFGAAACGGGLTQEQADTLETQVETQDQLLEQQQQQQEEIEKLEEDVAQLKLQLQGKAATPQQDSKKRQGGGEKEETLEK